MPALSDNARRSRAYRQRRRNGAVIVPIEVDSRTQKALIDAYLVDLDVPVDRAAITAGVSLLLEFLRDGEITAAVG